MKLRAANSKEGKLGTYSISLINRGHMEFWGITDTGKVRKHNQDIYRVIHSRKSNAVVMVVCDGMGGANAGNVASTLAVEAFIDHMGKHIDSFNSRGDATETIIEAVLAANTAVFEKSFQDEEYAGMGTTLIAAVSTNDGEVVANIGDSRAYHVKSNEITQITKDHSIVEDMIDSGGLTRSEARIHPSRNLITRALGTTYHEPPDIFELNLKDGEFLLLCSDGLSNVVSEKDILKQLKRGKTVRESCESLVEMTLSRGAPDNVTTVILKK